MKRDGRSPMGCLILLGVLALLWLGIISATMYGAKQVKALTRELKKTRREVEQPRSLIIDSAGNMSWSSEEKCGQFDLSELERLVKSYEERHPVSK